MSPPCHGLILYETTLSQEKRNQFGHINISRVMLGSSPSINSIICELSSLMHSPLLHLILNEGKI